jgi:hypothetical protein
MSRIRNSALRTIIFVCDLFELLLEYLELLVGGGPGILQLVLLALQLPPEVKTGHVKILKKRGSGSAII